MKKQKQNKRGNKRNKRKGKNREETKTEKYQVLPRRTQNIRGKKKTQNS